METYMEKQVMHMEKDKKYNYSKTINIIFYKIKILELFKEDYQRIGKKRNGLHVNIHY
jgi:hypothetical protein